MSNTIKSVFLILLWLVGGIEFYLETENILITIIVMLAVGFFFSLAILKNKKQNNPKKQERRKNVND